jgi:hypothetical protein
MRKTTMGEVLAWMMIAGMVMTAGFYLWDGDYRRAVYWSSAAILNGSVTL